MLTWMIYAVSVSATLGVAAMVAEQLARQRRTPSRGYWLLAIVASLTIPTAMTSISFETPEIFRPVVQQKVIELSQVTVPQISPTKWVESRSDVATEFRSRDSLARIAWFVASTAMAILLLMSALHLHWRKRQWQLSKVCETSVYLSSNVGPAVVGLIHPRIVLPAWLLQSPASHQSAVIAHEQSHIDAGDPALLTVALCLLALMPWNLPLWWHLRCLRRAIEVDCDARVLKAGQSLAIYGETLVAVGERQSRYMGSVAGMSESRSFLERRLKIMLQKPAKRKLFVAVFLGCLSTALVAFAAQVSPPMMNDPSNERHQIQVTAEVMDNYVGTYRFTVASVMTVRREGDHLETKLSNQAWVEYFPESETEFFAKTIKATKTFIVDDKGRATALILHQNGGDYTMPRIDAAEAAQIEAAVADKIKAQTATPGSEAALRRLIAGTMTGNPNYNEMGPALAKATREQLPRLKDGLNKMGAVQTVQFVGVGNQGWDVYQVRYEYGTSTWRILLSNAGVIEGALVTSGP